MGRLLLLLTLTCLIGAVMVQAQLITQFQICEMQCFQDKNLPSGVTFDNQEAAECRDYCVLHAYDHIMG
ncbi:hypothetical protein KP79_PYT24424 [Mizuhopecten yessoensis]|uniref:Uncharacterized protein n=1 Tax=Mizuhopecten yessoensis TaxID=6573 RepID=A0A210QA08_MIZYE|nr:hypothetical protein KP79_PYT24424 [Mizuhopecten yessoensis]